MALCWTCLFSGHCSMSPYPFTSRHYFAADINLNGTDTHWLIKLTDQEIFHCLCVLVCVWAPVCSSSCVLQEFMGWCHSYAALPSGDLQNSHLRFYAEWQSPWERTSRSWWDNFIYGHNQSALVSRCARDSASFQLMLKEIVFNKKIMILKKQLLKQEGAKWRRYHCTKQAKMYSSLVHSLYMCQTLGNYFPLCASVCQHIG